MDKKTLEYGFVKKVIAVVTVINLMMVACLPVGIHTEWVLASSAAKRAFREFLSQPKIKWNVAEYASDSFSFRYMEVRKDIPVLIVTNTSVSHSEGWVKVYQYVGGTVKKMTGQDWVEEVYPKAGIFAICYCGGGVGETDTHYWKISNKKTMGKEIGYTSILPEKTGHWRDVFGEDLYEIGEKKVLKKKFMKYLKKQTSGEKAVKISPDGKDIAGKYYKNTQQNRNKYLS